MGADSELYSIHDAHRHRELTYNSGQGITPILRPAMRSKNRDETLKLACCGAYTVKTSSGLRINKNNNFMKLYCMMITGTGASSITSRGIENF